MYVYRLDRTLIQIGVTLKRPDQLRDSTRGLSDLGCQALHGVGGPEAPNYGRELLGVEFGRQSFEPGDIESQIHQGRRVLPGFGNVVRFQPGLQHALTVAADQRVQFWRPLSFFLRAAYLGLQHLLLPWSELQLSKCKLNFLKPRQLRIELISRPASGGGRVVELMRHAGGESSQLRHALTVLQHSLGFAQPVQDGVQHFLKGRGAGAKGLLKLQLVDGEQAAVFACPHTGVAGCLLQQRHLSNQLAWLADSNQHLATTCSIQYLELAFADDVGLIARVAFHEKLVAGR